jgi:hypothetical protein
MRRLWKLWKCRRWLAGWVRSWQTERLIERFGPPNVVIGGYASPYMLRWWVLPRNRWFNLYLHLFLRSDDPRALHDHPWANCSWLLAGRYVEHVVGGSHARTAGDVVFRWSGATAHRIELTSGPCLTLFCTGPVYRSWGFLCPKGWRHADVYRDTTDRHDTGRGCDD